MPQYASFSAARHGNRFLLTEDPSMSQTVQADLVRASALGDELDKPEAEALAALMGSRTLNDG